jgi:hypothetical protein
MLRIRPEGKRVVRVSCPSGNPDRKGKKEEALGFLGRGGQFCFFSRDVLRLPNAIWDSA